MIVGGGAGDALGYPVEFSSEKEIRYTFGEAGITSYQCDKESGLAVVSDDTQIESAEGSGQSWLRDIPELYVRRAPGRTCLDALTKGEPVERSKGCGGVMRVAPVGLYIDGDSDSTGAITGNIVGAAVGYQRIDSKWKKKLEFHKLLLTLADDLCYGCRMSEYGSYVDWEWRKKYIVCGKPKGLKL